MNQKKVISDLLIRIRTLEQVVDALVTKQIEEIGGKRMADRIRESINRGTRFDNVDSYEYKYSQR